MEATPQSPTWHRARAVLGSVVGALFLVGITAPTLDLFVRPDSVRSPEARERRKPAGKPAWPRDAKGLVTYPQRYENYFKDSFGLRDRLLRWNGLIEVLVFGISTSKTTYFGREGWLFFGGDRSLDNHRGRFPFGPAELAGWARALERRRSSVETVGARYLYVVAPDKESIYPELLPEYMRPVGPTRLDQWLEYLSVHAPQVEILDLRPALLAAKLPRSEADALYGHLGTHWTGRGMQVAMRAILERASMLVPGFHPEATDSYVRRDQADTGDSWAPRMYIEDILVQENHDYLPPNRRAKLMPEGPFGPGRILRSTLDDPTRPRVLMLHDSFGPVIEFAMTEQCSYLEAHWSRSLEMTRVMQAEPDLVIDLHVERSLNFMGPNTMLVDESGLWSAKFQRSSRVLLSVDRGRADWGLENAGEAVLGPALQKPRPRLPVTLRNGTDKLGMGTLVPVPGEVPVLHAQIDSPFETSLTLWYRPEGVERFLRRNGYSAKLRRGYNDVYLPLQRPGTAGKLLLSLGTQPGTYVLRNFELRSVPPR